MTTTRTIGFTIFLAIILSASTIFPAAPTQALSGSEFNPGRIIDNGVFENKNAMNVDQIQRFLSAKVPTCDSWGTQPYAGTTRREYSEARGIKFPLTCLKDYHENPTTHENNLEGRSIPAGAKSAAQIIYDAAQQYTINPQVLIVLLQKEQALVTDDWPWPIQYRSATGYGCPDTAPCDSEYYGFYNQVMNAARQFRRYATYPNNYNHVPNQNNFIRWSPNSTCGGSTVYIHNQATASLYNYTPYQPNQAALNNLYGTGDNCSAYGNRNFWRYFRDWFGATIGPAYAWQYDSQSAYTDSTRTRHYSYETISLAPGEKAYIVLRAKNTGGLMWHKGTVKLATARASDRSSAFADGSWTTPSRINLQEDEVYPSSVGTFVFSITAPTQTGSYREYFNLVAEGITWMNDLGMHLNIDVTPKRSGNSASLTKLDSGQSLETGQSLYSPDDYTIVAMQGDGNLVIYRDFRAVWSSGTNVTGGKRLTMQNDGNLVITNASGGTVWSSGTTGNPGAYFMAQADSNTVVYTSSSNPVWSSGTDTNPDGLSRVNPTLPIGALRVNQSLTTADLYYKFILQGDGNLVLYANNRAIWSSGTHGKPSSGLVMQADGNLVIYTPDGKPLWSSGTDGKGGARLTVQGDGNLVMYTPNNQPVWSSNTAGVR
ncbi:MAG: hypothetical protein ACREGJ_03995 [Candidatus Saccharimonadales bacterium]